MLLYIVCSVGPEETISQRIMHHGQKGESSWSSFDDPEFEIGIWFTKQHGHIVVFDVS